MSDEPDPFARLTALGLRVRLIGPNDRDQWQAVVGRPREAYRGPFWGSDPADAIHRACDAMQRADAGRRGERHPN